MQIQQPNIVGNFLNAYQSGLERQEAQKEAERQRMRQDRADQRSDQQFQWQMDDRQLQEAMRRKETLARAAMALNTPEKWAAGAPQVMRELGMDGEVPGFDQRDRIISESMTIGDQLEQQWKERGYKLDEMRTMAQVRASDANAAQSYAAAAASRRAAAQESDDSELDPNNPFAGLSPKAKERLILQNAKEFASVAKQNDAEAQAAGSMINQARRFAQLSSQVNAKGDWSTGTGAFAGLPGVRQIQGALDSRFSEMEAISAQLIPKLREPGSGATSDFDARMFARGTVGVEKPGPANRALSLGLVAASQNVVDKARFEEAYFKARKTLVGAQEAWQGYLEDNPIFDTSSADADLKLNKSRSGWKQYFGLSATPSSRASTPPAASGSNASAAGTAAPQTTVRPGTIEDGYRFLGGDPSNQANWVKVK